MKVYLSSRYDRRRDLIVYRDELADNNIGCISRWLDIDGMVEQTTEHAIMDMDDVRGSDVLVAFSEEPVEFSDKPFASRGGRHVEVGLALAWDIPVIMVGPAENVFSLSPGVTVVSTWFECKALLFEMAVAS